MVNTAHAQLSSQRYQKLNNNIESFFHRGQQHAIASLDCAYWGILDCKLSCDDIVYVLEFGSGYGAAFDGYNSVYPKGMEAISQEHIALLNPYQQATLNKIGLADFIFADKFLSNFMFKKTNLLQFKPPWRLCYRRYTENLEYKLAQEIRDALPSEKYILKPLNEFLQRGIYVFTNDELERILKFVLTKSGKINERNESLDYWNKENDLFFLIESYQESKHIEVNEKKYDGTIREVFIVSIEKKNCLVDLLGEDWKLPRSSIDKGNLNSRTISHLQKFKISAARVSPENTKILRKQLTHILPKIYLQTLEYTPQTLIDDLLSSDIPDENMYGYYLLVSLVNSTDPYFIDTEKWENKQHAIPAIIEFIKNEYPMLRCQREKKDFFDLALQSKVCDDMTPNELT